MNGQMDAGLLLTALGIRAGERVALVGGGGKTGLAYRLIEEAHRRGWSTLFTTTTKLLSPPAGEGAFQLGEPDLEQLRQQLQEKRALYLARRWLDEWEDGPAGHQRKVEGFSGPEVARIVDSLAPDLAIVEADGSRHRPLKAPAAHEPVIPAGTTLLLVVAGLSVLGQPLGPAAVQRPERVVQITGVPQDTPVDARLVAAVLAHPKGGLKGLPPQSRAVAVLAQASTELRPAGRAIARSLLRGRCFERVLLADLASGAFESWQRDECGGLQVRPGPVLRVHAVVLAAGSSRRMGQNKLLLPLAGKPLVAHAVDTALGSQAAEVWVVVGTEAAATRLALEGRPVRFLSNDQSAKGQSTSLHAALAQLPPDSAGILFVAGDMPLIPPEHLDRLIARLGPEAIVVWSGYGDVQGVPALFGRESFPALRQLQGDSGGRALAGRFAEAAVPAAVPFLDIDTLADYEEARRQLTDGSGPEVGAGS